MPLSNVLEALAEKGIDSTACDASGRWYHTDAYFAARYSGGGEKSPRSAMTKCASAIAEHFRELSTSDQQSLIAQLKR